MIFALTFGMVALLLIGMPVALALGLSSLWALLVSGAAFQPSLLSTKMQFGLQNFVLVGIPLFILAAKLMNTAGITERLLRFARLQTGGMAGGLAQVAVVLSMLMGGICGSAVAHSQTWR